MAQVVGRRPFNADARVHAWVSPCRLFGGQSGTGTRFPSSLSVFSRQYYFTIAIYTNISLGG
jgi:hypothetical protein